MTKTRSMQVSKPSQLLELTSQKIHKDHRLNKSGPDSAKKNPTKLKTGRGKASQSKAAEEKKEVVYSDLVNLNLIKKFDTEALLDQSTNHPGDCHLPRGKFSKFE